MSAAATTELYCQHGVPVCCPAETGTCHRQCDSRLAASATLAKPCGSICCRLSPAARRRTAQCSPVLRQQWTPSATRRTLADNAAGVIMSNVVLPRIARRVDAIVLRVDWQHYSEHLFI